MTEAEMVQVLAVAATYDARLTPPTAADTQARARAWAAAVAADMPVGVAIQAVVTHYGRSRDCVMPADLNEAWRRVKNEQVAQLEQEQRAQGHRGVPMPPEVRAQVDALLRKSRV